MNADVRIFPDPERLSAAAAEFVADAARAGVAERGRFTLALSGGRTPQKLYELLATRFAASIPWRSVHLFWSDERCVPPDGPLSNFRMVREFLLNRVAIPPPNIHRVRGEWPPEEAATQYEAELASLFVRDDPFPKLDLILLGIGADGHTASLFPGSPALCETRRSVVATEAPEGALAKHRVTLTLPVLNAARAVLFLATGADKTLVVKVATARDPGPECLPPAARVRPAGDLFWFLDRHAAGASAP